jgi:hypothetical protein
MLMCAPPPSPSCRFCSLYLFLWGEQLTAEEKAALEEAAAKKAEAAAGGMGMAPFVILILAFVAYMYMQKTGSP